MIADAIHSLSDFITDIVVIVLVGISAKPQDASHDYGHGKYETLATFMIAIALAAAATGIIYSGSMKIYGAINGEPLDAPSYLALVAAIVSIVVKELLYQYTARAGRRLKSDAVVANAWHHRSDALSSIGAAIGIGGAVVLGDNWTVLDPVASVAVGVMLGKVAYDMLKKTILELTDCSLPEEDEAEIVHIASSFEGVSEPHNLRTRKIGNRVAIEVHIRLDGDMKLRTAHEIVSSIENRLRQRFGSDAYVTIHAEPIKER
jgi:cation diffusion facilitator family transporter